MKKIILLMGMMGCLIAAMTGVQAKPVSQPLDQIVAVVNEDVVTQSELNRVLSLMRAQFAQANKGLPPRNVLREQALNELINKKLQLQIAKQVNLTVTNSDLDRVVQNIASNNNMSVADLYHRIQQEGMSTEEYRNEMREQMTVQKLQQQEAGGQISVTPDEIDRFLRDKSGPGPQHNSVGNQEFHLQDILIMLPDTPSAAEMTAAEARAHSIIAQLHQGKQVQEIIKATGEGQLTEEDLGWRKLAEIPSAFTQDVINMKGKEIAGPVRTANGLHIIQLVGTRGTDSPVSADATPNRAQIQQLLMQRKFAQHVQNWISRMRSQAFISLK